MKNPTAGFSLIELLVVLGLIAAISAVILPNLGLTPTSQVTLALREFTNTLRSTYDGAILTGRIHRLVLQPSTGAYWPEAAPLGYIGRPPVAIVDDGMHSAFRDDDRTRLIEELDKEASDPRNAPKASKDGAEQDRKYSQRSILVVQRAALKPIQWQEVDDAVLSRRSLPGEVAFASIFTESMDKKLEFSEAKEKDVAYIYFFPSGETVQASVQLTLRKNENTLEEDGPKFTVVLDPLTGHSELLEGFQDPEFVKDAK